jgi:branched-chain amino acid transport system substrate-binding protein
LITPTGGPIQVGAGNSVVYAAEKFINRNLGGIDGHPISFVTCETGQTDEQAQACGQQFLNNPSIQVVLNEGESSGNSAFLSALGGAKVEFCAVPTPSELTGTNVFCPTGGVEAASSTLTYLQKYTHAKSIAQLVPDSAIFQAFAAISISQAKSNGFKATAGYIPLTSTDVLSAVIAGGVQQANAIFLTLTAPSQCIAVAQALKSLGIASSVKIVSLSTCEDPAVAKALGGLPHWTFFDTGDSIYLPNPQVQTYMDVVKTYGDGTTGPFSTTVFATTLWMAKILNEVGPNHLTAANVAAAAKSYKGPVFLSSPDIAFGQPPWKNAGSLAGRFFSYEGNGKWVDATNGKWLLPPASK